MSRYVQRITSYIEQNPTATLKEARGRHPVQQFAYRTSFVLKLPVVGKWQIIRRSIIRIGTIDTDSEFNRFINWAGRIVKSHRYVVENRTLIGIEDNAKIPRPDDRDLGVTDDEYDEGST